MKKTQKNSYSNSLESFVDIQNESDDWENLWVNMPEYIQDDEKKYSSLQIHFKTKEDFDDFVQKMNQPLTEKTKSIWIPERKKEQNRLFRWVEINENKNGHESNV